MFHLLDYTILVELFPDPSTYTLTTVVQYVKTALIREYDLDNRSARVHEQDVYVVIN
jgi:hypothetical protein